MAVHAHFATVQSFSTHRVPGYPVAPVVDSSTRLLAARATRVPGTRVPAGPSPNFFRSAGILSATGLCGRKKEIGSYESDLIREAESLGQEEVFIA
eukprot:778352-Rhodomonas_salina.1